MFKRNRNKVKITPKISRKVKEDLYKNNPYYKALVDAKKVKVVKKAKNKSKKGPNNLSHLFKKSYSEFLKSDYWIKVRNKVLERDKFTCTCGSNINLHVHHKTYKNHFKEHLHLQDLITLCNICHKKEHGIT